MEICYEIGEKNRDCFLYTTPSDVNLVYCLIDVNTVNEESILQRKKM